MSFKKTVEEHWLVVLIGIVIVAGGLVFSVTGYFHAESAKRVASEHRQELESMRMDHEAEVRKLRGQIDFGKLRIKGDGMELRSFVVREADAKRPPGTQEYDASEGLFYAPSQAGKWRHVTTKLGPVFRPFGSAIIQDVMRELESFPNVSNHAWVGGETQIVEESMIVSSVCRRVSVQRASVRDWRSGMAGFWESGTNAWTLAGVLGVPQEDIIRSMNNLSEEDISQMVFLFEFCKRQLAAIVDSSVSFSTVALEKQGNALYARFLTTLGNVTVGGSPFDEYYVREQILVIPTARNLYVVSSCVPGENRLPEDQMDGLSDWLSLFLIVER